MIVKKASTMINLKFQIIIPPSPTLFPPPIEDDISYKNKFRSKHSIRISSTLTFPTEGFKVSHSTFPDLRINLLRIVLQS